jgi:ATP-dependent Clp protease ATP-binding subunit ClpA
MDNPGDFHIEPEHILLALIHEDNKSVGTKVLKELGVDLSEVRSLVLRHLRGRERETVLAETTTGPTKPVTGPRCRGCRGELSKTAAYEHLEIPEYEGSETRQVLIVFCSHCGVTQGFLPPI